MILGFYQSLSN